MTIVLRIWFLVRGFTTTWRKRPLPLTKNQKPKTKNLIDGILLALFTLAACDNVAPTPTPTRVISGPTLAASPEIFPFIPTNPAFEDEIAFGNDPTAAALPRDSELPPLAVDPMLAEQEIIITAADGMLLPGWLYVNPLVERAPGVLVLGDDLAALRPLAERLRDAGFSALAITLRDVGDFDSALTAFSRVGLVDPGRLAVVGAATGANQAFVGCAVNNLCDGAAVFSPVDDALLFARMPTYGTRGLFLSAGLDDAAYGVVERMRAAADGDVIFAGVPGSGVGLALFEADAGLFDGLVTWLNAQFA